MTMPLVRCIDFAYIDDTLEATCICSNSGRHTEVVYCDVGCWATKFPRVWHCPTYVLVHMQDGGHVPDDVTLNT